ncbi:MAG: hypothetical protein H6739_05460 [Alphaproteobacteria bacterium]|nr:hypothetical protein [Alphaproteobacteria bacterium]
MPPSLPSCQRLRLSARGYVELVAADGETERAWATPDSDSVVLKRVAGPSPFAGAGSLQAVADVVDGLVAAEGGDWVEVRVTELAGRPAVQALLKHPQAPKGTTYTGLFVMPFEGFSFEVRVACEERGEPGARETRLLNQILGSGDGWRFGEGGRIEIDDWDPDNPRYDDRFPDHPASRARRAMAQVAQGLGLDLEMISVPSVALPE